MSAVMLALCVLLVVDVSTLRALIVYAILAAIVTAATLPGAHATPAAVALFAAASLLKLVVAPGALAFFVARTPSARDLQPAFGTAPRLVVMVLLVAASNGIAHAFPVVSAQSAGVLSTGLAMALLYRNLAGTMIGLLVFGSGLALLDAIAAPSLPATIDLGAAFDALVTTFIALAVARELSARRIHLDVALLRRLRG